MPSSIRVAYATFRKDAISVAPSPVHTQHFEQAVTLSLANAHLTLSRGEQLTSNIRVHDPLEGAIRQPHRSAVCIEVQAQLRQVAQCEETYNNALPGSPC